ncbi:unnamed protein product [Staurois parvus]|uniref:Uncharacterized protein n=1 Tax=Staurois parvus TaxID=386267 RepID=A0ABN9CG48_9NEOB|nr:unnamed protein product [Staurois parvus]
MAFNFGSAAGAATNQGTTGFSLGSFTPKTTASGFGFGTNTTTASTGFGGGFGGFGTTSTTASGTGFSFSAPTNTGTTGLFGNNQNKGFGFGTFGTGTNTSLGTGISTGFGLTGFNTQPQQQPQQNVLGGGLFGQPAQNSNQSNQLYNAASALNAPTLLGDERDAILAKWNQLQALWGTGKGYFNSNIPPVEFTQENHFCRFKVTYRPLRFSVYTICSPFIT